METHSVLTLIGLGLNLVGTILIAIFGVPQPDHSESPGDVVTYTKDKIGLEKWNEAVRKRRKTYTTVSLIGLTTLAAGFVVQAVAVAAF